MRRAPSDGRSYTKSVGKEGALTLRLPAAEAIRLRYKEETRQRNKETTETNNKRNKMIKLQSHVGQTQARRSVDS